MRVISLAFFRHAASGYETPACGATQGIFFKLFIKSVIHAHWAVWGSEWWLEIAHDDRVKEFPEFKFLEELNRNCLIRLRDFGKAQTLCGSMLERMGPVYDPDVEVVVCRDLDSLPMHRDRVMVDQFIASRASVHAIHDSESHSGPLMGGMVAFKANQFRAQIPKTDFDNAKAAYDLTVHGSDQRFLNALVYPRVANNLLIHTRRPHLAYPCMRSYPVAPQVTELDKVIRHIGAAYDCDKALEVLGGMKYDNKALIEKCWEEAMG